MGRERKKKSGILLVTFGAPETLDVSSTASCVLRTDLRHSTCAREAMVEWFPREEGTLLCSLDDRDEQNETSRLDPC